MEYVIYLINGITCRDRVQDLTPSVELVDPRDYPLPPYDGVTATPESEELGSRCLAATAFDV